jgi:hypothetical protein
MRQAAGPFLDALYQQVDSDLDAFIAEFPEEQGSIKKVERPRGSIHRVLPGGKDIRVTIHLDFHRWRLIWTYAGNLRGSSEAPVFLTKEGTASVWLGSTAFTSPEPLSEQILRPLLFPDLTEAEQDPHGPARG